MLRKVYVVQQIMTEFNVASSEEAKLVVITEIVLNLKNQNSHKNLCVYQSNSI
jgi:hypothetical protein